MIKLIKFNTKKIKIMENLGELHNEMFKSIMDIVKITPKMTKEEKRRLFFGLN